MNSGTKRILLYLVPCVLLAGAIPTLTQQGGGESEHRPEHRAPPPTAPTPIWSSRSTSPATTSPMPPTSTRTRPAYPDQPVRTAGAARAIDAFMPGCPRLVARPRPASAISHATAGFIGHAHSHPPNVTSAQRREHAVELLERPIGPGQNRRTA
jgi:hypothetical protein